MQQLAEIIISRISEIKKLQLLYDSKQSPQNIRQQKRDLILNQRNAERYRNKRQMFLLPTLSTIKLNSQDRLQQVYDIIKNVISQYDPTVIQQFQQKQNSYPSKLHRLYFDFFTKHNYKEKLPYIRNIFKRNFFMLSPENLLSWLIQWSKKQYSNIIEDEIEWSLRQLRGKSSGIYFKQSPKSDQISLIKQIRQSTNFVPKYPKIRNQSSSPQIKKNVKEQQAEGRYEKPLRIHNRAILHRYLADELIDYYQIFGCSEEVDTSYAIKLQKKPKRNGINGYNMEKAVKVCVQTSGNSSICLNIREYQQEFENHKRKKEEQKMKKFKQKLKQHTKLDKITINPESPTKKSENSRLFKSPAFEHSHKRQNRYRTTPFTLNTEGQQTKNKPKLSSENSLLKLPQITLKCDRQENRCIQFTPKSKITQNQLAQDKSERCPNRYNLSQRRPGQGLIIQNLLNKKEREKRMLTEQSSNTSIKKKCLKKYKMMNNNSVIISKPLLTIESKPNPKQQSSLEYRQGRELSALRKKTKALLKNFNVISKYQ